MKHITHVVYDYWRMISLRGFNGPTLNCWAMFGLCLYHIHAFLVTGGRGGGLGGALTSSSWFGWLSSFLSSSLSLCSCPDDWDGVSSQRRCWRWAVWGQRVAVPGSIQPLTSCQSGSRWGSGWAAWQPAGLLGLLIERPGSVGSHTAGGVCEGVSPAQPGGAVLQVAKSVFFCAGASFRGENRLLSTPSSLSPPLLLHLLLRLPFLRLLLPFPLPTSPLNSPLSFPLNQSRPLLSLSSFSPLSSQPSSLPPFHLPLSPISPYFSPPLSPSLLPHPSCLSFPSLSTFFTFYYSFSSCSTLISTVL